MLISKRSLESIIFRNKTVSMIEKSRSAWGGFLNLIFKAIVETLSVEAEGAWACKNHQKIYKIEFSGLTKIWDEQAKETRATERNKFWSPRTITHTWRKNQSRGWSSKAMTNSPRNKSQTKNYVWEITSNPGKILPRNMESSIPVNPLETNSS